MTPLNNGPGTWLEKSQKKKKNWLKIYIESSRSLEIRELQIKHVWGVNWSQSEWQRWAKEPKMQLKGVQGKGNPHLQLLGLHRCSTVEISVVNSQKAKKKSTYDPAVPLLGMYSKDSTSYGPGPCSVLFVAFLLTIARKGEQPKCPTTDKWTVRIQYIYTIEYYSVVKSMKPWSLQIIRHETTQTRKTNVTCPLLVEALASNLQVWVDGLQRLQKPGK